jgi:hypothetical protein
MINQTRKKNIRELMSQMIKRMTNNLKKKDLSFTSCFEDVASNHNYVRLSITISTLKINHMK